jgi:hypothetical protein
MTAIQISRIILLGHSSVPRARHGGIVIRSPFREQGPDLPSQLPRETGTAYARLRHPAHDPFIPAKPNQGTGWVTLCRYDRVPSVCPNGSTYRKCLAEVSAITMPENPTLTLRRALRLAGEPEVISGFNAGKNVRPKRDSRVGPVSPRRPSRRLEFRHRREFGRGS